MLSKIQLPFKSMGVNKSLFFLVALAAISLASCKTDPDPVPGENPVEKAIIPAKDQSYYYKITDTDGVASGMITKVVKVADSSGISVSHLVNITKEGDEIVTIDYKAYSQNGVTTNVLAIPSAFQTLVDQLKEMGAISDLQLTGFPLYQMLENKGTVNSSMTFKGGPIKLLFKVAVPDEEGDTTNVEIEAKITYNPGKVVKEEAVTTPAGTFNCSKWEYSYEAENKITYGNIPGEVTKEVTNVTVWTAPGVGIVKSTEVSEEGTSTTVLEKVEKQS